MSFCFFFFQSAQNEQNNDKNKTTAIIKYIFKFIELNNY